MVLEKKEEEPKPKPPPSKKSIFDLDFVVK
jgi:hypothetical protein